MKREFGSKLIEEFLTSKDLRLVVDTSGAYIPGHGTPTLILVGRNQLTNGSPVRAVLGVRGEPGRPVEPAKGLAWRSIEEHVGAPGWDDEWITVVDLDRERLDKHPWSLSGGGAVDVMVRIDDSTSRRLDVVISGRIGFASFPGADDVFFAPEGALLRARVPAHLVRPVITGDVVRDYVVRTGDWALAPYDEKMELVPLPELGDGVKRQWPFRTVLGAVTGFGGETQAQAGQSWWGWYRWVADRYRTPLSIAYAEVTTHNHFVLDRGGKVFKQTAPVVKLPEGASEGDHLALLGVLNSSTACFWLRQRCHNKGRPGAEQAGADEPWEHRYHFNGSNVAEIPLPAALPLGRGCLVDALAQRLTALIPESVAASAVPTAEALAAARSESARLRARMVAVQEELDWEVYRLYGLVAEDLTYAGEDLPGLVPGERAFAVALARRVAAGAEETTWFVHHNHKHSPITELPAHWPAAYRDLVQRRLDLIAADPAIRLLEKPEHKRRWAAEPWEKQQERALRGWLLDRLEDRRFWFDAQGRPQPRSVAQLADEVARDADLTSVLTLWEGRPDVPVADSLVRLLADEAVPYLAAYRYKDSGLRKRAAWEETWALQRREDAGERLDAPIHVPPKYTSADFTRTSYWQARGKLDVPKERFVLYPEASRETDPTPLLGWAGWMHAEQALALHIVIAAREADGWADSRLVPLVAGLAEMQPWVDQWHDEVDPTYGVSLAAFLREQLAARRAQVGKTEQELAAWRPEPARRGRRPRVGVGNAG